MSDGDGVIRWMLIGLPHLIVTALLRLHPARVVVLGGEAAMT